MLGIGAIVLLSWTKGWTKWWVWGWFDKQCRSLGVTVLDKNNHFFNQRVPAPAAKLIDIYKTNKHFSDEN